MIRIREMSRKKRVLLIAPIAILGLAAFVFIGGEIVHLLWNWLAPTLFGWRQITFWQALGVLVLCRILFGGFAANRATRGEMRRRILDRMSERMAAMTPEERERIDQTIRERCGFGRTPSQSNT
jgi:uncharacterized membrane protein